MCSKSADELCTELFRYTSGRWLWYEEQQLRDRFSPFNVSQLQRVAAAGLGVRECVGIAKLAEGSFNKTFKLTMDDGSSAIARIPHPVAGPRHYTTASEVATMDFARNVLDIPAPQVFAWSADAENPVGSEYIIMEHAPGTKLDDVWNDLSLEEKVAIVKNLVSLQKKMLSLSFNRYGNLYYASDNIQGAVPAEVTGDVPTDVKETILRRFAIGPVADRAFWSKERAEIEDIDRGPWKRPQDYAASVAQREMKWISRFAIPKQSDDPLLPSVTQNIPSSHISLLQRYLDVAPYFFPGDDHSDVVASYLSHTDLHSGNIFVENGRISSLIDWQETWAAPLLLLARHPRLVDYDGEIILKPPANFKELDPTEKKRIRETMSKSIILYLYEQQLAEEVPLLDKAIRFEYGRTRCEPVLFAGNTWDNDIIPLRESLIRVEKYWDDLGINIPCPIHFTDEDLRLHDKEGEGWNDVQDFWKSIEFIVMKDGWTSNESYDDACKLFGELRETGSSIWLVKREKTLKGRQSDSIFNHKWRYPSRGV
ncbi:hypothetical protein BDV06DRAFT_217657 [Aspergillus oleicola]